MPAARARPDVSLGCQKTFALSARQRESLPSEFALGFSPNLGLENLSNPSEANHVVVGCGRGSKIGEVIGWQGNNGSVERQRGNIIDTRRREVCLGIRFQTDTNIESH